MDSADNKLISDFFNGDAKSLELLVNKYLSLVYNFTYRYVGSAADAEDIVQEVFVKVWRHLKKFDQQKNFKTWLLSIAKNTAIDFLRKKKDTPFSFFDQEDGNNYLEENLVDPEALPDELFDNKNLSEQLSSAIDELATNYRAILLLYYNYQFTLQEIADSLDEPINTIKSRHRRAIIQLKKLLLPEENS
jgi:RNA polymerase sigma factor (sigma-70 family)